MNEAPGLLQLQLLFDVCPGARIRGGGQGDARYLRKQLVQTIQFLVIGTEVMAPLRHAMRLIDGEQRQLALL